MGGYPSKESSSQDKSIVRQSYSGPPLANLRMIFTNEMASEAFLCYENKQNENKKLEEYNFFTGIYLFLFLFIFIFIYFDFKKTKNRNAILSNC